MLKRWWYALPDWPPANYDYGPSLEEYKLRVVPKDKFRYAPETDDKGDQSINQSLMLYMIITLFFVLMNYFDPFSPTIGRAKCFEVLGYTGVFKDKNVIKKHHYNI